MNEVLIPTVRNAKDVGMRDGPGRIYVGRPSPWGNPYEIGRDGTREQVLEYYRTHLEACLDHNPYFLDELRDKDLVCWCAPERCHADILLEYANAERPR